MNNLELQFYLQLKLLVWIKIFDPILIRMAKVLVAVKQKPDDTTCEKNSNIATCVKNDDCDELLKFEATDMEGKKDNWHVFSTWKKIWASLSNIGLELVQALNLEL